MGSSNRTIDETVNISTNLGFELEDEAQAVGVVGDGNVIQFTDAGALRVASDIANNALDSSENAFDLSLGFAQDATNNALSFANNATKSDDNQSLDKIAGYIPIMVIVGGLAYVLKGK